MIAFATYAVCCMFSTDRSASSIEEILTKTHPPSIIRQRQIIAQVVHVLHIGGQVPAKQVIEWAIKGMAEAEAAWAATFGLPVRMAFDPNLLELGVQMHNVFEESWKMLHPQLEGLKRYGNLASAVNMDRWQFEPT